MTAQQIIGEQYMSKEVDTCIRSRFPADLVDDVKQDLFEILLRQSPDLIVQLHHDGKIRFYIVRIILNLCRQTRNVVHKTYRQKNLVSVEEFAEDDKHEDARELKRLEEWEIEKLQAYDKLHWYEKEIFQLWVKLGSLQKVSDFTTIDYNSLKKTVQAARKKAKRYLEEI